MTVTPSQPAQEKYIEQLYRPSRDGFIVVYAGDLLLSQNNRTWTASGDLQLSLAHRRQFYARFTGLDPQLAASLAMGDDPLVELPPNSSLEPPTLAMETAEPSESHPQDRYEISLGLLSAGRMASIQSLILHITGELTSYPLPKHPTEYGPQGHIHFSLPGWTLQLAEASMEPWSDTNFSYVIKATPNKLPVNKEQVHRLIGGVFILLQFVASGGIAIGPRVGLDEAGHVVWAEWAPTLTQPAGQRWCTDRLVLTALPILAEGLSGLSEESAIEFSVDRAVTMLLATNEPGVLDVKIPIICAGLEILAWSTLQYERWLNPDDLAKLSAGARTRLLLQWAGIPIDLPANFDGLSGWRQRGGRQYLTGPDLIFEVRNRVVHPPKKVSDPEWPKPEELWDALRLGTWYLELALLRILGYGGEYASRLHPAGWRGQTEPVPWRS